MRFFSVLTFSIVQLATFAQGIPGRPAFDTMLEGLLEHDVPELSVNQVASNDAAVFLDARSLEEYEVSHIPDAHYVGYEDFSIERVPQVAPDALVVVYCSVGYRSEEITRRLRNAGIEKAGNLYGGIFQWVYEGHTVVNAEGATKQVHGYDKIWGLWLKGAKAVY